MQIEFSFSSNESVDNKKKIQNHEEKRIKRNCEFYDVDTFLLLWL